MKKVIKLNTALLIILCYSFCSAQHRHIPATEDLKLQQEDIKNTAYIFEGIVIEQNIKGDKLCSVLRITKIFRGNPQIKLGTIKVVTEYQKNITDGAPDLAKGRYIIFGRLGDSNSFHSISTDNAITITNADLWAAINDNFENGHPAVKWGQAEYPTLDSLYSFFKANGLTVQEEQK